jgi:ABC-type antimicrobial peptide transport system permease subunit
MALGADGATIRRMVFRESGIVILAGLATGVVGALGTSRFLQTMLFEIRPSDPVTIAGVSLLLVVVGFAACYVPARRATRVDPIIAMRVE